MVKTRKSTKGGKKTPEKMAIKMDMFDDKFDNDVDSDDGMVQKTPFGKTPKGKQSLNDKRVSFQVPGKNTPGKNTPGRTPVNNNSVTKKQNTPGKLQPFKGMKQNNKSNQNLKQDDDDDDDEDDDEDDSDIADLDMDLGDEDDDEEGDDAEDDDDDDDEEEDDDDDDDDDDEETVMKNKVQKSLQQKIQKKAAAQSNSASSPKKQIQNLVQTPNNVKKEKNAAQTLNSVKKEKSSQNEKVVPKDEIERRKERDAKQLFVGNIPYDTTPEELKVLSKDIKNVIMPKRSKHKNGFAFLQFESEEIAEKNFEILKNKKFKGETLKIDFAGEKSILQKKRDAETLQYNMKKLHVSNIPINASILEIAKFFPKSFQIGFNQSPVFRTATVSFWSEEDANEAYQLTRDIELSGQKLSVLHALTSGQRKVKKRKFRAPRSQKYEGQNRPAKKMKMDVKDESD